MTHGVKLFRHAETGENSPMAKDNPNTNRLRVRRVVHVPLREVSGICLRRGRGARMSLIAVGDRAAKIAWFSQPRSEGGRIEWHTKNIAKLAGSMLPKRDSQIEAVCADGLGRVLLLQETPPRVELIDPKTLKVTRRAFARRQGEETGGPRPLGVGPRSRNFAAPFHRKIDRRNQLAVWLPDKELAKTCADFSDLEIGPDGYLYLLSDKSSTIARMDDLPAG